MFYRKCQGSSINCTYLVNEVTYGTRGWASTLINPGEYFRTPDCQCG